ncbi:MAG TPA: 50S ribosomal protein L32 [Candidatus Hydrogenedentes bacterium]|nr:50S ribosomal protein L32 [Candidatus Hydrogenedentota bacterium]HIJ74138.1 50S ribosomal protein L32 [Candidatus Hydrogenedentota bacterium]
MPVPKRRTSKTKRNMRRSHHALRPPSLAECPSCGERIMPHRVCPKCGHYKDRLIIGAEKE